MFTRNPRLKTIMIVFTTALLAATVSGCCDTKGGIHLQWEKIADGDGAGGEFTTRYADLSFAYVGDAPPADRDHRTRRRPHAARARVVLAPGPHLWR